MPKKIKVAIIDYQLSNLFSVQHACNFIGLDAKITSDKRDLENVDGVILPGVGAFGDAMSNLKKLDLIQPIKEFINCGKPFMGICLGLQLLFSESQEFGIYPGLDIIKGNVKKFPKINLKHEQIKVPQIGWNSIYRNSKTQSWNNTPLKNLSQNEFMYFVHSYYTDPLDQKVILSLTNYSGIEYCSSILYKNIFATQFHPEKSGPEGIKIYQNWAKNITKNL